MNRLLSIFLSPTLTRRAQWLSSLAVLLCATTLQAAPIDKEQALAKARQFYTTHGQQAKSGRLRQVARSTDVSVKLQNDYFYVFAAGEDDGFVIISGDDATPSVLGYADKGTFSAENMPENMKAWLEGYADQIRCLQRGNYTATVNAAPPIHPAVQPLMKSMWGQDGPYNLKCPVFFDEKKYGRAVTGCVATAMAQVMYYHKFPASTTQRIPGYQCRKDHSEYIGSSTPSYVTVPAFPVTSFDWDNILPVYDGDETDAQKNAVATLMLACGTAMEMDYGINDVGGSGAYSQDIKKALTTYFNYDKSMFYASRNNYTLNDWDALLYGELTAQRPICYNGQSIGGGHEFVIDGYDGEGYYHLNWGWTGWQDGYFLLDILTPGDDSGIGAGSGGYNCNQFALIGMKPNANGANPANDVMTTDSIGIIDKTIFTRSSRLQNFTGVNIKASVWNRNGYEGAFDIGFGVYDENDNLKSVHPLRTNVKYAHGSGYVCYRASLKFDFGINLDNGTYRIRPISKATQSTKWLPNIGSETYFIRAQVTTNSLELSLPFEYLHGSLVVNNSPYAGGPTDIRMYFNNDGEKYIGNVYLYKYDEDAEDADNVWKMLYAEHLEIGKGESQQRDAVIVLEETGRHTIVLFLDEGYSLASTEVVTKAPKPQTLNCTYNVTNGNNTNFEINSDRFEVDINYRNIGTNNYDDFVQVYLIKEVEENKYAIATIKNDRVTIPSEGSVKRSYVFKGLENGTTYFARAFYNSEGEQKYSSNSNLYTIKFTVPSPYAVLNNGTLSFYYDSKRATRKGQTYDIDYSYANYLPAWAPDSLSINSVVFDSSFANYTPNSTAYWFGGYYNNLTSITGLKNLNTEYVTSMDNMFRSCKALKNIDVSGFKTGNVTTMRSMFYGCNALESVDVSKFDTKNVRYMNFMFCGCNSLETIDVSRFETGNVIYFNSMFSECNSLKSIDVSKFDMSSATDISFMFNKCSSLTFVNLSQLNTENVTSMKCLFQLCTGLKTVDLKGLKTSNVKDMGWMFTVCSSLQSVDISGFDTRNVTNMKSMFNECESLRNVSLRYNSTPNVTDVSYMFNKCSALESIDLTNFNTKSVTNMEAMFQMCTSLKSADLSSFNTSNVTDLAWLFYGCSALADVNVSSFNTRKTENFRCMFYDCGSLTKLDVGNLNTTNATDLGFMFRGCSGVKELDLTGFSTSNVTTTQAMLFGCSSLKTIYASEDWKTDKLENSSNMFGECTGIVGGAGTRYNDSYRDITYARIDGGTSKPGYFTYKAVSAYGDVNGDTVVDVADIASIINVMSGGGDNALRSRADVNGDGAIDVADIAAIINKMAQQARTQKQ